VDRTARERIVVGLVVTRRDRRTHRRVGLTLAMRAPRIAGSLLAVSLIVVTATGAGASSAPVGNVSPALSSPGTDVAVVASAAPVDDRVAVLIQNGSAKAARIDLVTATATSRDGGTVTRARSVEAFPQVLAPGELALAAVQFRKHEAPLGGSFVVKVRGTPVQSSIAARALTVSLVAPVLSPPQTGSVAQTLGATVTNDTTNWTARGAKVAVMCFGEARQPTTITTRRLHPARLAPGKQAAASVPLAALCPTYLVAARAS